MAFIVEDGTGKSDANAYCDVAFVDAYFADVGGNATWTAADNAAKQAAIVKATRYIDQRFARQFRGLQLSQYQSLQWPREVNAIDWLYRNFEMPLELKRACAEYAVRSLVAPLVSDPAESQDIVEKSVKAGPVEKRTKYAASARRSAVVSNAALKDYPAADLWVESLLRSSSSSELARV